MRHYSRNAPENRTKRPMGEQGRRLFYGSGGRGTGPVISGPVMGPPVSQLDLPASSLSPSASRSVLLARCKRHSPSVRALDRISWRFNIGSVARRASEFRKRRRINSEVEKPPLRATPPVDIRLNRLAQ